MLVKSHLSYADVRKAFNGEDIYLALRADDGIYNTQNSTYQVMNDGTRMVNTRTGESWDGTIVWVAMDKYFAWDNRTHLVVMEETAQGWKWALRTSYLQAGDY